MVHYAYLLTVIAVFIFLLLKKQIIFVTISGTFFIGLIFHEFSVIGGLQTVFFSMVVTGKELFDIVILISVMVALLEALKSVNADNYMVAPFKIFFINPKISFWVLGLMMYFLSLVFWPTPATALVASVLAPAAIKSGLSPLAAAVSINLLGHGMALSGDFILQATSGLSEKAAGLERGAINQEVLVLSLVTGIIAITTSYFRLNDRLEVKDFKTLKEISDGPSKTDNNYLSGKIMAALVMISFLFTIFLLAKYDLKGEEASSLLGGLAISLVFLASCFNREKDTVKFAAEYLKKGFVFAIKIFSPVIPIAGFFFLGSGKGEMILGETASPILLDIAKYYMDIIPSHPIFLAFANMFVGIVSGLDGSGFSGLSLTANLAKALAEGTGLPVEPLIAIGQMGSVWCGGGTIISWSFGLLTTAGLLNVDPAQLAKENFFPVLIGLTIATITSVILMLT
ncbi:hypothetical protein [Natranaerofaba carboxydovora]|uniref:hypothetical protein n=1 Tax=Natranaerofaba carboxydovora TaxID=2742683 RepID=UPI001F1351F7|nr:hypothetical protein [Natranaerofaba carboxydovora]UMZ73899.1 hypothetical protein ACONDI_01469 [Natranaerofaba carboxydovora]